MWCQHCRQDVPALPSDDQQMLRCPRCSEALRARPLHPRSDGDLDKAVEGITGPRDGTIDDTGGDDWELDEELRHIGRMLQAAQSPLGRPPAVEPAEPAHFHSPHAGPPARHAASPARHQTPVVGGGLSLSAVLGAVSWVALLVGTGTSVCGGMLLGWSLATERQELWTVGLPMALTGQIALLAGLVLQLDRLWRDSREAAAKLDNVDEQLHELKAATTLLGKAEAPSARAFYSHFASGASPQLLLGDLRRQLDLLARKISQEQG